MRLATDYAVYSVTTRIYTIKINYAGQATEKLRKNLRIKLRCAARNLKLNKSTESGRVRTAAIAARARVP